MTAAAPTRHIRGLDGLRFVLALWVAFGHGAFIPLPAALDHGVVRGLFNSIPNGAAAVMVFFVISGFCIHYPFRAARSIDLLGFYARRHIRILLPIVAAVLIARPLGIQLSLFQDSILWSLVCEEIYYTIYPVLLWARARVGWPALIVAGFAGAFGVVALDWPTQPLYALYGWQLNWLVGLPCWLLGAHLAESLDLAQAVAHAPGRAALWAWRLGALVVGSMGTNVLWFHSPVRVPYPISLDLFALYAFFWLRAEIRRAEAFGAGRIEPLGAFSYSMYLVHVQALALFALWPAAGSLNAFAAWLLRVSWVIAFSWMFYRLVEKPAHQLARRFQQRVVRWRDSSLSAPGRAAP